MNSPAPSRLPSATALSGLSESGLRRWVYGLSIVVVALVTLLMSVPQLLRIPGLDVSALPAFHAFLNGSTAVLLLVGFVQVRRGRWEAHRAFMVAAFTLSTIFLLSYVVYHSSAPPSRFGGEGAIRAVYFFILITHVVLAAGILPLALFTLTRAFRAEYPLHRRIARVTFPLWMYVTITGVLVYLMMRPWYAA